MAENLKVTHYANGTAISLAADVAEWISLGNNNTDKAYCYYNNDANNEADIYGALYTWATASNGISSSANPSGVQGICPIGWHLPSNAEWSQIFQGGFPSIPGGFRDNGSAGFMNLNSYGFFWASTDSGTIAVYYRIQGSTISHYTGYKAHGISVRCIMD